MMGHLEVRIQRAPYLHLFPVAGLNDEKGRDEKVKGWDVSEKEENPQTRKKRKTIFFGSGQFVRGGTGKKTSRPAGESCKGKDQITKRQEWKR